MVEAIKRRRWAILVAVGVLGGIGAVAQAAIPDGSGIIHGCYAKNGDLRAIDSATDQCKSGETALDWAQTGPQGPQGPQGPPGTPAPGLGSSSKLVVLSDDDAGHAAGWDPDESRTSFNIAEPSETDSSLVSATVNSGAETSGGDEAGCVADTRTPAPGGVHIKCNRPVNDGGVLVYLLVNP